MSISTKNTLFTNWVCRRAVHCHWLWGQSDQPCELKNQNQNYISQFWCLQMSQPPLQCTGNCYKLDCASGRLDKAFHVFDQFIQVQDFVVDTLFQRSVNKRPFCRCEVHYKYRNTTANTTYYKQGAMAKNEFFKITRNIPTNSFIISRSVSPSLDSYIVEHGIRCECINPG